MRTIRLSNGVLLRYRAVPPYATTQAFLSLKDPPPPKEEIESAAGHTEKVSVDEDSEAYAEWVREAVEVKRLRAQRIQEMSLDYGIVSWLFPPPEGIRGLFVKLLRAFGFKDWQRDPPAGWEIPDSLARHGVKPYLNARLTYIYIELITTREDLDRVSEAVMTLSRGRELTEEEVEAAEASFRAPVGRRAASGSTITPDNGDGLDSGGDLGREGVGAQATEDLV